MIQFYQNVSWYWPVFHCIALVIVLWRLRKSFYGKLLAAGFSVSLAMAIFPMLELFYIPSPFQEMLSLLSLYGYILLCLGIASIRTPTDGRRTPQPPEHPPELLNRLEYKTRNLLITILLLVVTANIYWVFWLYRSVKELKQLDSKKMTFSPGQAIGYMFIPLFNIYWLIKVVIRFPQAVHELTENSSVAEDDSSYSSSFVSILMILAILTNVVMSRLSLSFFFIGELMFITAVVYTQRYINHLWPALAVTAGKQNEGSSAVPQETETQSSNPQEGVDGTASEQRA